MIKQILGEKMTEIPVHDYQTCLKENFHFNKSNAHRGNGHTLKSSINR